jgi:AGZA family xanthine/uracil permease-like MFS transporter
MTTFIVEREFSKASGFAAAGAVLTFFGLMHGEQVGADQNRPVVFAYLVVAGFLLACRRFAVVAPVPAEELHGEDAEEKHMEPAPQGDMAT